MPHTRKQWFLFCAFLLFLLSLPPAHAQERTPLAPPEIMGQAVYIPYPVRITLDGSQGDWNGVPQTTVSRGTQTSSVLGENNSFTFAVAADSKNLYILMTMPDQNIVTGQHGSDYWNEDSLEFYINFTGNLSTEAYTDGIFQVNINPGNIGKTDPGALTVSGTNADDSNTQGIVFKTSNGWGFEASIPLPFLPEHGKEIGFEAQANGASENDRDVRLIWSLADTDDRSWQNPSLFGRGIFFEVGRRDIPELTEIETLEQSIMAAVNQTGYFADGAKIAMLYGGEYSRQPIWELRSAVTTAVVLTGTTETGFYDPSSDFFVYRVDFSEFKTPGRYVLNINGVDSYPFEITDNLYTDLKHDALHYFYLNRSGITLVPEYAGQWSRPAGHLTDNSVTCFQGEDAAGQYWNGCDYHLDVSGGWYDAGDYGKYIVSGGITLWTLMNLYERNPQVFPDGSLSIPENTNGWSDILDEVRWELEFMLHMQVPDNQPLGGMVHHKIHDLNWAGFPAMPPTEFNNDDSHNGRFLMPPGTSATLNLAAAAAQCARISQELDPDFASRCLRAAERAWLAAGENEIVYYGSIPGDGGGDYEDSNLDDEFYRAAAELYITTGKEEYRDFVTQSPYFRDFSSTLRIYLGNTAALGSISLALLPNHLSESDIALIRRQIIETADEYLARDEEEGYYVPLATNYNVTGSNSSVLNSAMILALAYDFTDDSEYMAGVIASMDYLLGANALNRSFVSGYGTIAMRNPHHRFWANRPAEGYPPPPPGALAGGSHGNPSDDAASRLMEDLPASRRYIDSSDSYSTNEVAINWNAPLVWVAAYLDEWFNPPIP